MKNLLIVVVTLFLSSDFFAQKLYETYPFSSINKTFDILVSENKNEEGYTVWIDMYSTDALYQTGGIYIKQRHLQGFIDNLKQAKMKYVEWENVAKTKGVKDVMKTIPGTSFNTDGYFKAGGKFHFDFSVSLDFKFNYKFTNNQKSSLLVVYTGSLNSNENKYIKTKDFCLVFENTQEIDDFIIKLDNKKIINFMNKQNSTDQLFK